MKARSKRDLNRIPLFDSSGKKKEPLELDKELFNGRFNEALLYHSLKMYRANQRKGSSSTKTRADVAGGGKKPWRQKGTGRARTSSIRNPIWRGGGIAFGPHPRDVRYSMPKKMRKKALLSSINAKLKSGEVVAIEGVGVAEPKTKLANALFKKLNIGKNALFLVENIDRNLALASRNIKGVTLKSVSSATSLDVLSHGRLVMARSAIEALGKKEMI